MSELAPFPMQADLTAIAIGFKNGRMIADEVAPRVPVNKQEFKYLKHDMAEGFTIPDTRVGRKSKPNEVDFSATEETDSTQDYGLDDPIPQADIDNAPENYDPRGKAVEQITNLILLDREVRVANMVFNADTYNAADVKPLSGSDMFTDKANSTPLDLLVEELDKMIMRGNVMTIGRVAFSALARHPQIVKAVHGNSGDSGIARREDIAELLELEAILVGEARINTARKGQPMDLQRAWGNHISLQYRDKLADTRSGTSFALTAQFGDRVAGSKVDGDIGIRGGQVVRAGESVKELVTAKDLGRLIQNVA